MEEFSSIPLSAISGALDNFTIEDMQRALDELTPDQAEELERLWGWRA